MISSNALLAFSTSWSLSQLLVSKSAVYALLHNRYRWVFDHHDHRTRHSGTHLIGLRDTRLLRVMTPSDVGCDHRRDCQLLNDAWPDDRLCPAPWSGLADGSTLDCTNRPALDILCGRRWQSGTSVLWGRDLTCRCLDISWMLLPNAPVESSIVASVHRPCIYFYELYFSNVFLKIETQILISS